MVNGNTLTQTAIGQALGLSRSAISKLKKQGMPVDSVVSAQAWRTARQNVAARKPLPATASVHVAAAGSANMESHEGARTRREIAEANLAELKLAELSGDLVRVADIRAAYARRVASLREALLQLPARLAPVMAAEADMARCHATLTQELQQLLEHAATSF